MKNINIVLMSVFMLLVAGTAFAQNTHDYQSLDLELASGLVMNPDLEVILYKINEGQLIEISGSQVMFDEERLKINEEPLVVVSGEKVYEIKTVFISTEDVDEVVAAEQARRQKPTGSVEPLPKWMQSIH